MANDRAIVTSLEQQFVRVCEMWRNVVVNIPEEEWRSGEIDYLIPARHLCHVVISADFYTGDQPIKGYDWHKFFGGDWEGMSPDELPDKARALEIFAEVEAMVLERLGKLTDADLVEEEKLAPWTGGTVMDKLLYWLRHHQHHVGELHAELRHRSIPRAKWR